MHFLSKIAHLLTSCTLKKNKDFLSSLQCSFWGLLFHFSFFSYFVLIAPCLSPRCHPLSHPSPSPLHSLRLIFSFSSFGTRWKRCSHRRTVAQPMSTTQVVLLCLICLPKARQPWVADAVTSTPTRPLCLTSLRAPRPPLYAAGLSLCLGWVMSCSFSVHFPASATKTWPTTLPPSQHCVVHTSFFFFPRCPHFHLAPYSVENSCTTNTPAISLVVFKL